MGDIYVSVRSWAQILTGVRKEPTESPLNLENPQAPDVVISGEREVVSPQEPPRVGQGGHITVVLRQITLAKVVQACTGPALPL